MNSTVAVWEDLLYPRSIFHTGNTSTAYVAAWLELHDGRSSWMPHPVCTA